jgi:DUF438 domain-containing protein
VSSNEKGARGEHLEALKRIIRHLHAGESPEAVREQMKNIVRSTTAEEIAAMEQALIAEGMAVSEIQSMCDLHSALARELLPESKGELPPGHPLDTFRRENGALRERVAEMRRIMTAVAAAPSRTAREEQVRAWKQVAQELLEVEKHYQRKEHLLFPFLERHGVTGPTTVMWGKDDEARNLLKGLVQSLAGLTAVPGEERGVIEKQAEPALHALEEMFFKEEQILFPLALEKLDAAEWGEIWRQYPEYGGCLVEPQVGYRPPEGAAAQPESLPAGTIRFATGQMTPAQLWGILTVLPVDLSFVDADDRVVFFSPGPERVFARSQAILGRKVQQCHPPKSLAMVEKILDDFRAGRQNVAEFWIEFQGRFAHIRYFAVRGPEGNYLGTLEVVQDATRIRSLRGERRLLQYGSPDYAES